MPPVLRHVDSVYWDFGDGTSMHQELTYSIPMLPVVHIPFVLKAGRAV
jgi:hypothetical protein